MAVVTTLTRAYKNILCQGSQTALHYVHLSLRHMYKKKRLHASCGSACSCSYWILWEGSPHLGFLLHMFIVMTATI